MKSLAEEWVLPTTAEQLENTLRGCRITVGNTEYRMPEEAHAKEGFTFSAKRTTALFYNSFTPSVMLRTCDASEGVVLHLEFVFQKMPRVFRAVLSLLAVIMQIFIFISAAASREGVSLPMLIPAAILLGLWGLTEIGLHMEKKRFLKAFRETLSDVFRS